MKVVWYVVSMFLFSATATAQSNEQHYAAAKRFYEATTLTDTEAVVNQMVKALINQTPQLTSAKAVIKQFFMDILQSEEYADLKIRSYMRYLSPGELDELTLLLSSPAFQAYRTHLPDILSASNDGVMQIFQRRQDELRERLNDFIPPDPDHTD